jgi:arylsulfatase A-like enzyme/Flp pilus assembly protein TadD
MIHRRIVVPGIVAGVLAGLALWLWPRPRPNLLLITLDTTRADRLGCYGYSAGRTPVLDSLAASGILCERAYTVAPLTLPAHASLLTGLYPAENGVRTNGRGRLDDGIPTLAEVLKRRGYETAAFVASFVLDAKFGLDRGFRTYDDELPADEPGAAELHRQRSGEAVVDAALAWLNQKHSGSFFCWVHLYDPHAPYLSHADLFGEAFADRPYDAEIAYVDQQVGRLVEFLRTNGLDSRTLVVVVGDHGEGLGEHVERTHGSTLYNVTMQVPLIFHQAGRLSAGGRVAANVSLIDVSPTIVDLLGLPDPRKITGKSFAGGLMGGELPPAICYGATDEPFLTNGWSPLRSLTESRWKYIRTTREELYDLAADPEERENLAESNPEWTRAMAGRLAEFEAGLLTRETQKVQLSAAERRALASLGYAGGAGSAPPDGQGTSRPDIKDMLPFDNAVEDAGKMLNEGAVDAGIGRLREIVKQAPSHTQAHLDLSNALRQKSEFAQAIDVLHGLVSARPDSRDGHYGLGLVLLERGSVDAAIQEFSKTAEIDPDFADAHYYLAKAFLATGRVDEAFTHFDQVLDVDPCHVNGLQMRAQLQAQLGRIDAAIADLGRALECAPRSAEVHHNLGQLLAKRGDRDEARRHLVQATELSPRSPEFHLALGAFFLQQRQYDGAIEHLRTSLELRPGDAATETLLHKACQAVKDGAGGTD